MLIDAKNIKDQLILNGVSPLIASFATAQAAFETAGFTSNIYKKNNNAFGYKTSDHSAYEKYLTVNDSVNAWVAYWNRRRLRHPLPLFINTLPTFISYLKKDYEPGPYFEADEKLYYEGCLYHYNNLF